jgi:CMP-N-acetylneuraminic acid synthetase
MQPNILIIIPARGGSKGIPRKNLRALAGKPLIYYSIQTARGLRFQPDVYVSTDDSEIATIAEKLGASIIHRDAAKAQDHTTLDPVIFDGYQQAREKEGKDYDLIVTLQPTSPLLKSGSLDTALERMLGEPTIDTIISARDDTHLTWRREEGR